MIPDEGDRKEAAAMMVFLERYSLIEICALNNCVNGFGLPVPPVNLGFRRAATDGLVDGEGRWKPALARALSAEIYRRPKNPDGSLREDGRHPLDASESVHARAERRGDAFEEAARKAGDV